MPASNSPLLVKEELENKLACRSVVCVLWSLVTHHRKCIRRPLRCLWGVSKRTAAAHWAERSDDKSRHLRLAAAATFTMRIRTFKRTRMRTRYSINPLGTLWREVERRGIGFMVEVWRLHIIRAALRTHFIVGRRMSYSKSYIIWDVLASYLKIGTCIIYASNFS